jgi:hypothetical protein
VNFLQQPDAVHARQPVVKEDQIRGGIPQLFQSRFAIFNQQRFVALVQQKLFKGKKIECYSNDAERGKNGAYCALCSQRMNCRQRIRLMLLVNTGTDEQLPALLEINSNSFSALQAMLEPLKQEELTDLLIIIKVEVQQKYLQVQFKTLF